MRILSFVFVLYGVVSINESLDNLLHSEILEFVNYSIHPYFNGLGIVLGILFVLSGVGILLKKKYSYYLSVLLCIFFSCYVFISIVLMIRQHVYDVLILALFFLSIYLSAAGYILKHKSYFN